MCLLLQMLLYSLYVFLLSLLPQEKLSQQGEWDEEQLKTRMDQVPEQVGMDTGSTSKALKDGDEEEKKSRESPSRY